MDVINKIWRYEFFNNEYVKALLSASIIVACSWLTLKVVVELIMNYIVKGDDRGSPLIVYRGVVLAIVMMFLVTPLFDFGHKVSTGLTDAVINITGTYNSGGGDADGIMSRSLVNSMINRDETEEEYAEYMVNNWKRIGINDGYGGNIIGMGKSYKYSVNFFMLILLSLITIFLLFFVAIQMAKRVMEIALYKIIAPFCCTGLTNNQSRTFEAWFRSTLGLFLTTTVQFISIGLLLTIFGSAFKDTDTITGIFLVIGALLFIISTPTLISSLLNQQTGMMAGISQMQSLMMMSHVGGQALGFAGKITGSALSVGSKVVGAGINGAKGGASDISKMLNRSKTLTQEQQNVVKDTINSGNSFKAINQVQDYLSQNSNGKYGTNNYSSSNNMMPTNLQYNPLRDKFNNPNDDKGMKM